MNKIILTVLSILISVSMGFGQSKGITPLHKFLQQYADSTIIMEYCNEGYGNNAYLIISKTENLVNCFKYDAIDTSTYQFNNRKKEFSKVLLTQILSRKINLGSTPADVNIFFDLVKIDSAKAANLWVEIQKSNPWQLKDDRNFAKGNQHSKGHEIIMDGGYSIVHLITKEKINTLIFYAPDYYEKIRPGNTYRQSIIRINQLFLENYPKILSIK